MLSDQRYAVISDPPDHTWWFRCRQEFSGARSAQAPGALSYGFNSRLMALGCGMESAYFSTLNTCPPCALLRMCRPSVGVVINGFVGGDA